MSLALKLLCRVVRRRLENGEALDDILSDDPRLTEEEAAQVKAAVWPDQG